MEELTFRPRWERGAESIEPELSEATKASIEEAAGVLAPEIAVHLEAELRARLVHVARHVPDGDTQEVVVRSTPVPPFYEVSTRRA